MQFFVQRTPLEPYLPVLLIKNKHYPLYMSLPYYLLIDCLQSSDKPKLIRYAMSLDLVLTLISTFIDWYYKTGIEQFSRP